MFQEIEGQVKALMTPWGFLLVQCIRLLGSRNDILLRAMRHQTSASMAAAACNLALENADLKLEQIDLLISANATMDCGLPNNAAFVHRELGLDPNKTPAFDINMSCLSFLMAVDTISWAIDSGKYENVLIVSSDMASCGLNWKDMDCINQSISRVIFSQGDSK